MKMKGKQCGPLKWALQKLHKAFAYLQEAASIAIRITFFGSKLQCATRMLPSSSYINPPQLRRIACYCANSLLPLISLPLPPDTASQLFLRIYFLLLLLMDCGRISIESTNQQDSSETPPPERMKFTGTTSSDSF